MQRKVSRRDWFALSLGLTSIFAWPVPQIARFLTKPRVNETVERMHIGVKTNHIYKERK